MCCWQHHRNVRKAMCRRRVVSELETPQFTEHLPGIYHGDSESRKTSNRASHPNYSKKRQAPDRKDPMSRRIYIYISVCVYVCTMQKYGHGSIPRVVAGPPPLCYKPLSRRLCFKPLSRGIAGAPPILLTGMLRNSKQADTLRFHEGECAKYRKNMRVLASCQSRSLHRAGAWFRV